MPCHYLKAALAVGGFLLAAAVLTVEIIHAQAIVASQMANCADSGVACERHPDRRVQLGGATASGEIAVAADRRRGGFHDARDARPIPQDVCSAARTISQPRSGLSQQPRASSQQREAKAIPPAMQ
jgi:hypothetical protein